MNNSISGPNPDAISCTMGLWLEWDYATTYHAATHIFDRQGRPKNIG